MIRDFVGGGIAAFMALTFSNSAVAAPDCARPKADRYLQEAPCAIQFGSSICDAEANDFRAAWEKAFQGDVESLRYVAGEFEVAGSRVVEQSPTFVCAFRTVIALSGSLELTELDLDMREGACSGMILDGTRRVAAVKLADEIRDQIECSSSSD